ncbi:hypothetical protein [Sphingomonas sp. R86521]|uniref:hypothetical protein n=1 Tax=Sphingomonas sp. R86521 TaxID=3093860 RepID=UPI0036D21CCA
MVNQRFTAKLSVLISDSSVDSATARRSIPDPEQLIGVITGIVRFGGQYLVHDFFIGSALSSNGVRGSLALHDAFCISIQSRAMNDHLFVGLHDEAPCMVVYDRAGIVERHRLDRAQRPDDDAQASDAARRRAFGFVAPTRLDGRGRIAIAPWMCARRTAPQRALLVGMGDHFEIWNLDQVLEQGPADLAMLATLHMTPPSHKPSPKDARNAASLHLVTTPRRTRRDRESGVPVQPVSALPVRPGLFVFGAA